MHNIEEITIELDEEHFPRLSGWEPERLKRQLVALCRFHGLPITEENLRSVATDLETDIETSLG